MDRAGSPLRSSTLRGALVLAVALAGYVAPNEAVAQIGVRPGSGPGTSTAATFTEPDRRILQRMATAQDLLDQERYAEAALALGSILELKEDHFFQPDRDEPIHRSLKAEAQRLIGEMPEEGRRAYELQYGAQARAEFEEAVKKGSMVELAEVTRRFFHTEPGYQATYLLGVHLLDQGRPLAAALAFRQLQRTEAAAKKFEPLLSLNLAVCWSRAGMTEDARSALVQLKSEHPQGTLKIAGRDVPLFDDPKESLQWLATTLGPQRDAVVREPDEWAMHRGEPDRNALSAGDAPLLEEHWDYWAVPTTGSDPFLKELVRQRRDAYLDRNESIIPAFYPLSVDNMVLMRTARHLLAVDFVTGKRQWQFPSDDWIDPSLDVGGATLRQHAPQINAAVDQRMWHDNTFGTLSSDGEYVFSVFSDELNFSASAEKQRIVVKANGRRTVTQPWRKPYNRLVAHDIRTGKLRWELGGPNEDPPLELAGYFFLGPPLPLGKRLYTLAEYEGEVKLLALEAKTGKLDWSQQLAAVEFNIMQDTLRRLSGSTPSYSDGVLVCPTGAGAVVAVNLTTRSLLWGYRYPSERTTQGAQRRVRIGFGRPVPQPSNLGGKSDRWVDASPTIAGGQVLLTPVESEKLHCLDLFSGKKLWEKDRQDGLYVAAVHDGNALVIGHRTMRAYDLETGELAWADKMVNYPEGASPSGRGFFNGRFYFVPLTSAEVAKVDVETGEIVSRSKSRKGVVPGNLICYRGSVISQSVDNLAKYDQLEQLERQVGEALKGNRDDAVALARYGEILLHRGKVPEAITQLKAAYELLEETAKEEDSDEVVRTQELLLDAYLEGLRMDFRAYRNAGEEIEALIERPEQRAAYLRRMAIGLQDVGENLAAFELFMKFGDPSLGEPELEKIDAGLSVRRDRWVLARLERLREVAKQGELAQMDEAIVPRLEKALADGDPDDLRRQLRFFGTHPLADKLRLSLFEQLAEANTGLEAELLLADMAESTHAETAGKATALLAERLVKLDRPREAARYYERLNSEFADVTCLDGKTGSELVAALGEDSAVRDQMAGREPWPTGKVEADQRGGTRRSYRHYALELSGDPGPFFRDKMIELDPQGPSVIARDSLGRQLWRVALGNPGGRRYSFNPLLCRGRAYRHVLVLSLGYQIFGIDTLAAANKGSAKILWSKDLTQPTTDGTLARVQPQVQRMEWGEQRLVEFGGRGQIQGFIGPVTGAYVCFQMQRDVVALDPITGETLWERHSVVPGSELFGDEKHVFIVPPKSDTATVVRALDGHEVGTRKVPTDSERVLMLSTRVLGWQTQQGKATMTLTDALTEEQLWQKDFPAGSKATMLGADRVGVVDPQGKFTMLSVGQARTLVDEHELDEKEPNLTEIFLLESPRGFMLITNRNWVNNAGVFIRPMPGGYNNYNNPIINGRVYGFAGDTYKRQWSQKVEKQALLLSQPADLPVLVFACNIHERLPNQPRQTNNLAVLCIDKRTGRLVYEDRTPGYSSIFSLSANAEKKTVDVQLQRSTITLAFLEADPEEAGKEPPKEEEAGNEDGGQAKAAEPKKAAPVEVTTEEGAAGIER